MQLHSFELSENAVISDIKKNISYFTQTSKIQTRKSLRLSSNGNIKNSNKSNEWIIT